MPSLARLARHDGKVLCGLTGQPLSVLSSNQLLVPRSSEVSTSRAERAQASLVSGRRRERDFNSAVLDYLQICEVANMNLRHRPGNPALIAGPQPPFQEIGLVLTLEKG